MKNNQNLLSLKEAAALLAVKPVTLRKWDREGKLKAIRIGSRNDRRYNLIDLNNFVKGSQDKIVWQEYIRHGLTYRYVSMVLDSMTFGIKEYFGVGMNYLMGYFEGDTLFWYYNNKELHNLGDIIIQKFIGSKKFEDDFFIASRKLYDQILHFILENDIKSISCFDNKKLGNTYDYYKELVFKDNSMSFSIDAVDEALMLDITKRIKDVLKTELGEKYTEKEFARVYNILTRPSELSYLNEERLMVLELAKDVRDNKTIKDSEEIKKRLYEIAQKYWWTNLGWEKTEAKTSEDVLRVIDEILEHRLGIEKEITKITNYQTNTLKEKEKINKQYHFNEKSDLVRLIELYDRFVPYHDQRKETQMKTNHWEYGVLDEISRRTGISIQLLNWAEIKEIVSLLKDNIIDENELNQRSSNLLYLNMNGKVEKISGKQAKKRHAQVLGLELEETKDLQGMTASPGTVVGEAYVAITVANALKIKPGQILITGMTTPEYVPAMRRAAAIVTDEGGMTCHAAIISREIGVPCIVGIKYGTRLIKTGDKVEVKANHGVVRILAHNVQEEKEEEHNWFLLQERGDNIPLNPGIMGVCSGYHHASSDLLGLAKSRLLLTLRQGGGRLYFDRNEWDKCAEESLIRIKKDPLFMSKTLAKFQQKLPLLQEVDHKIEQAQVDQLTLGEIWDLYKEYINVYTAIYPWSEPLPIWMSDPLSDYLEVYLKGLLQENNQEKMFGEYFETLITSPQIPFTTREEKALLEIALKISSNKGLVSVFKTAKPEDILLELTKYSNFDKLINEHTKQFSWVPYDYGSPFWDKKYFVKTISDILKENFSIENRLKTINNFFNDISSRQEKLFRELMIDPYRQELFKALQTAIYTIDYKKEVYTKSHFTARKLMDEVRKRFNLTENQTRRLSYHDLEDILVKGERPNITNLNQRWDFTLMLVSDKLIVTQGKEAVDFLNDQSLTQEDQQEAKEIKGVCACGGSAKGIARVVRSSQDMTKVELGDILITYMTTPDFVPAMRKAAAIITNEGGITCHAAIVSRELSIPCIVGAKNATDIFHDGDEVEVKANHGTARIITSKMDDKNEKI